MFQKIFAVDFFNIVSTKTYGQNPKTFGHSLEIFGHESRNFVQNSEIFGNPETLVPSPIIYRSILYKSLVYEPMNDNFCVFENGQSGNGNQGKNILRAKNESENQKRRSTSFNLSDNNSRDNILLAPVS